MDATLRIKNLSIALEALSRISGYDTTLRSSEIQEILRQEIVNYQKEQEKETQWPNRPAKPTVYDKDPYAKDDDIPF